MDTCFILEKNRIALIGNNGIGKSTLLKLIANKLLPCKGQIVLDTKPYYVPQIFWAVQSLDHRTGIADRGQA
jgi:ATPase subunit of ABC transporter with duplicated ATPase domains